MKSSSCLTDYNFKRGSKYKYISPLIRDSIGTNSSHISLLFFSFVFCLSLEKKIPRVSQPPE